MPFVNVQRLDDLVDSRARTWRLGSTLFGLFGIAAVGLAAIGIFTTLSFAIRQRTAEIGLRLALGATQTHVVWTVTRSAVGVLATGLMAGGVAAWFGARFIEASLFGVEPTDIRAFATAAITIAAVGAAASVLPCLRARRIDPIVALRTE
jgi:ABC-type antimicrobial peptide transport system permease subunit